MKTLVLVAMLLATLGASAECVPITVANKRVVVSVTLDGLGTYPFLLDTGAMVTILDKSIAKGLPISGDVRLAGVGVSERVSVGRVRAITLGGFTGHDIAVLVYDLRKSAFAEPIPIAGVLGDDVLLAAGGFRVDVQAGCLYVGR